MYAGMPASDNRVCHGIPGRCPQNSLPALAPLLVIQHTMAPLQHGQLGSAVAGLDCSLGAACTERGRRADPIDQSGQH